jgi:hypothetical protein
MSASLARPRSRFWLFAPFAALVVIAIVWTAAWFFIRDRAGEALDGWIAREAAAGRRWECPGRSIAGYPFRIEVACPRLSLQRADAALTTGPLRSATLIYQPRHTIIEIEGPLRATDGHTIVEGAWQTLQASFRVGEGGFERASVVVNQPNIRIGGLTPAELRMSARHFEAHLRPNPTQGAEAAYDLGANVAQAAVPLLDDFIGGQEPLDGAVQLTVTQLRDAPARPTKEELDRWREAGGRLRIASLSLAKGPRRLEASGELGLDALRRPVGHITAAAAGLADLVGAFTGSRAPVAGGLIGELAGNLLGQPRRRSAEAPVQAGAQPALQALPPLRLDNGRVFFGPFAIPGLRLPPLY